MFRFIVLFRSIFWSLPLVDIPPVSGLKHMATSTTTLSHEDLTGRPGGQIQVVASAAGICSGSVILISVHADSDSDGARNRRISSSSAAITAQSTRTLRVLVWRSAFDRARQQVCSRTADL